MSIPVKAIVAQDYIEGTKSYILKYFPIRVDYKDGMWKFGNLDPHLEFLYGGYDLVEFCIKINEFGLYEIARLPENCNKEKDLNYELLTGSKFHTLFSLISRVIPHTEEIYDMHTRTLCPKDDTSPLEYMFLISSFWKEIKKSPNDSNIKKLLDNRSNKGYIYIAELDGCIKVGFSKNVTQRLNSYKTSNMNVKLLYSVRSTFGKEKAFHTIYNNGKEKYQIGSEHIIISNLLKHIKN